MVAQDRKDCTPTPTPSLFIFTYGTLQRGFSNHKLMQDLMRTGDATFVATCRTAENYPLVCGPYRVPFLLNMAGSGQPVTGELYAVSVSGLARLDELEGISRGHYERLSITVELDNGDGDDGSCGGEGVTCAEAYYAHRSYAAEMWKRNGMKGLTAYSEKEAKGYVKRKDRPHNLSFLDHIQLFLHSQD